MNQNNGSTFPQGIYTSFAKFQNLYSTVEEMYKSGSKQSHMALNIQFIISQMMSLFKDSSKDVFVIPDDAKRQIERHAKAFYYNYGDKEFYNIENQIGFIYCLIMLVSKDMIRPSTGYDILAALSTIDRQRMLQIRDDTLDALKSDSRQNDVESTLTHIELFAPDEKTVNAFNSMIQNTPQVLKPISKTSNKPKDVIDEKKEKVVENIFQDMERIVLKATPFDGDFHDYFQALTGFPIANAERKRNIDKPEIPDKPKTSDQLPMIVSERHDFKSSPICVDEGNDPSIIVDAKKGRLDDELKESAKIKPTKTDKEIPKISSEKPDTKSDKADENVTK